MNHQVAEKNSGKRRLIREWGRVRGRWKRRRFDLRAESDIGRAIRSSIDTIVTETEFDEQLAVVSSRCVESSSNSKSAEVSGVPWRPDRSIMLVDVAGNWWATGHQTPKVLYSYFREKVVEKVCPSSPIDVSTASFGSAPGTSSKRTADFSVQNNYCASAFQMAPNGYSNSRSLKYALSAVHLGEGCTHQTRHKIRQRLVSFLWDPSCLRFVPNSPVTRCPRQNGKLLHFFLRIGWKRRLEAATSLGIASSRRMRGPFKILGDRYLEGSSTQRLVRRLKRLILCSAGGKRLSRSVPNNISNSLSELESIRGPGSAPRMPTFPHDVQFATLGHEDHFCNGFWSRDGLLEPPFQVALSSLLRASSFGLKPDVTENIRWKIVSMGEVLVGVSHDSLQKCIAANRVRLDVPLIDHSCALDATCALASNALPPRFLFDSMKGGVNEPSLQRCSLTLVDRWLHATSPRFALVHLRFTLLRVALRLPGPLSVILLKSLDIGAHQTPFQSMRWFLDRLEALGVLIETGLSSPHSDKVMPVEELESILYDVSASLTKILERDPLSFTCRCWHLATLAACMVLCSGNRIESGAAYRFPSGSAEPVHDCNEVLSSPERGGLHHERRKTLPKFHSLRLQSTRSFKALLTEEKYQNLSGQWHLAIVSFLEWSQVVALLLGSTLGDRNIRLIQREHERHTIWLSKYSCTAESSVAAFQTPSNTALDAIARLLESNPSERLHWVRLVQTLGRFGDLGNDNRMRSYRRSECDGVRHALEESKHDSSWWGGNRVSWWNVCILAPTASGIVVPLPLGNCNADSNSLSEATEPLEWLEEGEVNCKDCIERENDAHSPIERSRNFANLLPASRRRMAMAPSADLPPMPPEFENDFLKLIVRGHLYGVSDPEFEARVVCLACEAWDFSNGSFRRNTLPALALRILQQKGLNLATIFEQARIPYDTDALGLT